MTWEELFERGERYGTTVSGIRSALADLRETDRDTGGKQ